VSKRDTDSESLSTPRAASPAFGSPIRREAVFMEEEDEIVNVDELDREAEFASIMRSERRKAKGKERETERDSGAESVRPRERERKRAREEEFGVDGGKLKLQDVTNSPRGQTVLPPMDDSGVCSSLDPIAISLFRLLSYSYFRSSISERDRTTSNGAMAPSTSTTSRAFLATTSTTPPLPPYLPTPRASSSPGSPSATTSEPTEGSVLPSGGRERRTRKSVNYAEPKLNTCVSFHTGSFYFMKCGVELNHRLPFRKMRKPDPQNGNGTNSTGTGSRKRSSTSAAMAVFTPVDDNDNDADNDTEARSSLEGYTNTNGHLLTSSMTPTAASIPLPPSRPTSSASMSSFVPAPTSRASASSSSATSVKRKKSRPYLIPDDDESDGTQADAEYGGGRLGLSGWVNIEGRRRSVQSGAMRKGGGAVNVVGRVEGDDERRHSMAI